MTYKSQGWALRMINATPPSFQRYETPEEFAASVDGQLIMGKRAGVKRLFRDYQRARPGVRIISAGSDEVFSTDRDYNDMCITLAQEASASFPTVADEGFLLSGAPSDFSALCTVAGVKMDPANLPPLNNSELIKERGLALSPSRELVTLADAVLSCVHRRRDTQPLRISRISSTTLNRYVSDMPTKQNMVRNILTHPEHVLQLLEGGHFRDFSLAYGGFFSFMLVERQQPDRGLLDQKADIGFSPKPRLVRTLDGAYVPSDKLGKVQSLGLRGWAARNRTAYAMSGPLAYFVSALRSAYSGYLDEYAFVWKHRSFAEMTEKVSGAVAVRGFDATQMDQHVPSWFLDMHADSLCSRVCTSRLLPLFYAINRMGYVAPPMTEGGPLVTAGDLTPRQGTCVGLASGRSDNPDIGKEWMTAVYLEMFFGVYRRAKGGALSDFLLWLSGTSDPSDAIDVYLRGAARLKSLNIGDDQLTWIESEADRWFMTAMDRDEASLVSLSEYVPIEYEKVITFAGAVLVKDDSGIRFEPNPVSYLVNWLVPERSAGSPARPFPGAGRLLAQEHYSSSRLVSEVDDLLRDVWARTIGRRVGPVQALIKRNAIEHPLRDGSLRDIDLLALNDPSVIHYKVDIKDLSPEVQKLIVGSIAPDELDPLILPFLQE